MKQPFFSVVIPTLNEEKYLPVLLKALSKQSFRDFEVILVDGGSTDKTLFVFQNYQKKLPKSAFFVSNKPNVGLQRNIGAQNSCGKYLFFIDADCSIDFTFLEEIHLSAVKKNFAFATTWIRPDSEKPIEQLMTTIGNIGQELAKVLKKQYTGGYNTIVKKEVFEKLGGFREDMKINEDHEFAIRAQKHKIAVCTLKEPQVIFSLRRWRSGGLLPLLRSYTKAQIALWFKGPLANVAIDYPMGGHVHKIRKNKANLVKLNTYLKAIKRIEKKIERLLEE
jgi:glycosyltransferase involved in cell wall biosynthesis